MYISLVDTVEYSTRRSMKRTLGLPVVRVTQKQEALNWVGGIELQRSS